MERNEKSGPSKDFEFFGKEIPVQNAQIGDLILFTETDLSSATIGHIGIITKANRMQFFIHSSSGKANGVIISSLASKHYAERFVKVNSVME